jgi:hypothetical protein
MVQQQLVAVAGDQVLMVLEIMLLKAVLVAVLLEDMETALTQTALMEQQILEAVEVVLLGQYRQELLKAVQAALVS